MWFGKESLSYSSLLCGVSFGEVRSVGVCSGEARCGKVWNQFHIQGRFQYGKFEFGEVRCGEARKSYSYSITIRYGTVR